MRGKRTRKARGARNDPAIDMDNPPLTEEQLATVRTGVPNIRAVRRHMGMTQQQFAQAYGLSMPYLRMIALDAEGTLKIRRENRLTSV